MTPIRSPIPQLAVFLNNFKGVIFSMEKLVHQLSQCGAISGGYIVGSMVNLELVEKILSIFFMKFVGVQLLDQCNDKTWNWSRRF